ncbi:hypothetical protein CROQUDRAFT_94715 [Cronartium quercuum f. sp. fusiforme G11]|uniref:Uncharacterized protein n=1 Tax=Cronartium quercuum f. sp. fusiforme G11 TaxID=708437 RepID=A0A9P6TBJ6_9BASI|nr:hypothetical protein CROQUDRAFT_94715 [Cronartium quercuum f. sp. fusiforme G11]
MFTSNRLVMTLLAASLFAYVTASTKGGWGVPHCNKTTTCQYDPKDCLKALDKFFPDPSIVYTSRNVTVKGSGHFDLDKKKYQTCTIGIGNKDAGCQAHRDHFLKGLAEQSNSGLKGLVQTCAPKKQCGLISLLADPSSVQSGLKCRWVIEVV